MNRTSFDRHGASENDGLVCNHLLPFHRPRRAESQAHYHWGLRDGIGAAVASKRQRALQACIPRAMRPTVTH